MCSATATVWLLTGLILTAHPAPAAGGANSSSGTIDAPVVAPKPGDTDAGHPPLVRGDSELRILADAENVHTSATLTYTPLRGSVDRARFAVPRSERLLGLSLNGSTPSYETESDGECTTVTVRLPSRTRESVSLEIHTQRPRSGTALDVGGESEDQFVRPLDVLQSHGVLLLGCDPGFNIVIEEARGLVETDLCSLRETHPGCRCFRFYGSRLRARASLLAAGAQVYAHQEARYLFAEGEVRLDSSFTYAVAGGGIFDLRLEIPESFLVDEVRVDDMPRAHRADRGVLALSFNGARHGETCISVTGRCPWQPQRGEPLPLLRPVDAASNTGTLVISAPPGLNVKLTAEGLSPCDPEEAASPASPPENTSTRAWRYGTPPGSIQVEIERSQPRISARLKTDVRISADTASASTLLEYDIGESGSRTFRFALPQHTADGVQIEEAGGTARIIQRTQDEADRAGWSAWTLRMNRDVLGPQRFRVTWNVPIEDENSGAEGPEFAGRLALCPPRVLSTAEGPAQPLEDVSGEMNVRADHGIGLGLRATTAGFVCTATAEGALVFRHEKTSAELEIDVSAKGRVPATTLVSRALIDIRPSAGGWTDYECRYRLQSDPRRLPIQLPAGSEPLSVLFDGATVPLLRAPDSSASSDYDGFEIDLSGIEPSEATKLLLVRFRTPLDGSSLTRRRGSLAAPLPLLGELDGRSAAVAETRTCVWLPEHLTIIGTPPGFAHAGGEGDHLRWIGDQPAEASRAPAGVPRVFQSHGRPEAIALACWDRSFATWLLSGAALLIALVLRPTAGENRLTMVLLGAVVLALLSLVHPHAVVEGLFAARWGLAAAAILWVTTAARAQNSRRGTRSGTSGPVAAVISPARAPESRLAHLRKGA